jgi:MazG family protein
MKPSNDFGEFEKLVAILRKECPWDRKQTHHTIKDNLIEEAYEVTDAIDRDDTEGLKRELGDLLLHVLFHSRIAEEKSKFTIADVIYSISEKLIRRHPHVFKDTIVESDQEVAKNWESIKLKEGKESTLDGIPAHLPALIRAQRMQEKAGNVGFDWSDWELAWEKLNEEIDEWRNAIKDQNQKSREEEFGDLLFSMVNVGRLLDLNAESALRNANNKFEKRFRYIEKNLKKTDQDIRSATLEEMDRLWDEAKSKGY